MNQRTTVSSLRVFLLTITLVGALCLTPFTQDAFAERIEGPERADPSAYEHIEDGGLSAQSDEEDRGMIAQATGGSNIVNLNLTLDQMIQMQIRQDSYNYSYAQFQKALDPNSCNLTVFADLTTSSGLTAAQIDSYIDSVPKARTGKLHGMGYAFIRAQDTYHINAAYLVAHAILETGWGTSTLASGYYYDGSFGVGSNNAVYPAGTYYNFFGIGAYDSSPISGGRSKAVQEGWNSPEAAVMGGAQWIARYYTYASKYPQPTLYAMMWDYSRASAEGSSWHQYCTGVSWHEQIADLMDRAYAFVGVEPTYNYVLPLYSGGTVPDTNARTMFRLYNPNSGEHFYTASVNERDTLSRIGWIYEGPGWTAPKMSNSPVYRLYNPNSGDHHYTLAEKERDGLAKLGWVYEGIGWYSDDQKRTPLYRQFNPNAAVGTHNYTVSKNENDKLATLGWVAEGVAWYGI